MASRRGTHLQREAARRGRLVLHPAAGGGVQEHVGVGEVDQLYQVLGHGLAVLLPHSTAASQRFIGFPCHRERFLRFLCHRECIVIFLYLTIATVDAEKFKSLYRMSDSSLINSLHHCSDEAS